MLDNAIVYDIESFPNCFTFSMEHLNNSTKAIWEISDYRDDTVQLMQFFQHLAQTQTIMIGFNNVAYDYVMIDYIFRNPGVTAQQIRAKNDEIFNSNNRFAHSIWANNRFAPQLDLFKLHHFDNKAKSTSLKGLQINMRLPNVVECELGFDNPLTECEVNDIAVPYNNYDVSSTKKFCHFSMEAIAFRQSLIGQFGVDVLNWNDTKIGEEIVAQRLGEELCFDRSSGKRKKRQTPRATVPLKDVIFPYISFQNPEFNRILDYLNGQTLRADELKTVGQDVAPIKTKGVFKGLKATVGGVEFHFGVGGIHGSLKGQKVIAHGDYIIKDIDVKGMYPSIAIVNKLAPAHLGEAFCQVYKELPEERSRWQLEKGKKCTEANSMKLAGNGVCGKSNSMYSVFYDPQFTMTVAINGQLMLAMLIEKLVTVPTLKVIQANTDGISYYIHKDHEPQVQIICSEWERLTALELEDVNYSRMFVRDVNTYIAEDTNGKLKLKGAYWTPDPLDYHSSIGNAQPPAWHKDLGNAVSARAAVAYMVHGTDIGLFIRSCTNPYDFMNAVKINRTDKLLWGNIETQRNTRFYISTDGENLIKRMSAKGVLGTFKKARGVTDQQYEDVMRETGGEWDIQVCTKNKSTHQIRETAIMAGFKTTTCNNCEDFSFNNVNYDWYIEKAQELCI